MNDNGSEQIERLTRELQDAHLVIGEQTVALRRMQVMIEQLQTQVKQLETRAEIVIPHSREEENV